jgi:hypothetical protein
MPGGLFWLRELQPLLDVEPVYTDTAPLGFGFHAFLPEDSPFFLKMLCLY